MQCEDCDGLEGLSMKFNSMPKHISEAFESLQLLIECLMSSTCPILELSNLRGIQIVLCADMVGNSTVTFVSNPSVHLEEFMILHAETSEELYTNVEKQNATPAGFGRAEA